MKQLLVRISNKAKTLFKRGAPLAMAVGLLASVVAATMPATATAAAVQNLKATPRVSFTFDDGLTSALTQAAPALAAHGLTGTDYVITNCVGAAANSCVSGETGTYMTWAQIAQLKAAGWEIASHTKSHIQLSTDKPTATELTSQLADSQAVLKANGYTTADLAFPYGDYDNNVLAQTAKYYESARGFADLGYNTFPYDNTLIVNQQIQGDVTVAQAKAYIDAAITGNQWLVLTFHNIVASGASTNKEDYQFNKADLEAIAAYVQEKQAAGLIKAVNVEDGLVRGTNLMPNGDFAAGITNGWTTNDPTNITADANNNGRYPESTHAISLKSAATATATTETHLFSPQISVSSTDSYIVKNYLNMLGGSVNFYVDEYAADGTTWLSGQYVKGMTYATGANAINVKDFNFKYTPTSASVAKARLQIIVSGVGVQAYLDNSQWLSVNEVAQTPPVNDTTAPVVSNVTVSNTTATGTTITWTTDEPTTGTLNYGTTPVYGQAVAAATLGTTHTVTLTGLTASTNYQFQIIAKDAANNVPATPTTGTFGTLAAGTPGTVFGDLTNDGLVNNDDATILFANWGSSPQAGDLTNDGVVNNDDATLLFANWSK